MRVSVHDIRLIVALHGILMFVVRPGLTLAYGPNVITGDNINMSLYILSIIFSLFSLGITSTLFVKISLKWQNNVFLTGRRDVNILGFSIALLTWIVLYFITHKEQFTNNIFYSLNASYSNIHSNNNFIPNLIGGGLCIFVVASYRLKSSRKIRRLILFILLLIGVLIGVMSGSKTAVLTPMFYILLRYSSKNGGVPLRYLILLMVFGLPLFVLLELFRHDGVTAFLHLYNVDISAKSFMFLLTSRFYGTDIIYVLIEKHLASQFQWLYGSSIFSIIYFPIPRTIWSDKPIISFGKIVSEDYLGGVFSATGISAAPTFIGELFVNFGFIAPLIFVVSVLIIRYMIIVVLNSRQTWLKYYFYPLMVTTFSFFQEASIAGWLLQLIGSAVLIRFFVSFFKLKLF